MAGHEREVSAPESGEGTFNRAAAVCVWFFFMALRGDSFPAARGFDQAAPQPGYLKGRIHRFEGCGEKWLSRAIPTKPM